MKRNTWGAKLACMLLIAGTIASVAIAANTPGSQENPLVTLDYLNGVIEALKQDTEEMLNAKTDELLEQVEAKSAVFTSVTVQNGQSLYLTSGTQIVLCSGSADSPGGILNTTAGEITSGSLKLNSLYIAVGDNHRITVTENTSFLILGTYSIS